LQKLLQCSVLGVEFLQDLSLAITIGRGRHRRNRLPRGTLKLRVGSSSFLWKILASRSRCRGYCRPKTFTLGFDSGSCLRKTLRSRTGLRSPTLLSRLLELGNKFIPVVGLGLASCVSRRYPRDMT
jgi:hypothetical protein